MARPLSEAEAQLALATEEGLLFVDSVRQQLQIERLNNAALVEGTLRHARFETRLMGSLERAVGRFSGDQSQLFARTKSYRQVLARIDKQFLETARALRDQQLTGLQSLVSGQDGLGRTRVRGARVRGLTVTDHWNHWSRVSARRVKSALTLGIQEGMTPAQIRGQLRQLLRRARRDALAVQRTVARHVIAQAREAGIRSAGFTLVRYVAILDTRTTEICRRLGGRVFQLGKGPRPPRHFQCRSFVAPALTNSRTLGRVTSEVFTKITGIRLAA